MKKIIFIGLLISIFSCSKDDNPVITDSLVQELPKTTFTIKDDGSRTMNNIQVGERILLEIKIQNIDNNPDATYVLRPITESLVKHQLINTDYLLQTKNTDGSFTNVTSLTINTSTSLLYLQVLRPGTFQHEYTLQKFIKDAPDVEVIKQQLVFSAVRFIFSFPTVETRSASMWHHSIQRRDYYIKFDDGSEQYDNYLTPNADKALYFRTDYEDDIREGAFTADTWYDLRGFKEQQVSDPPVTTWSVNNIKISQTFTSGSPTNNIIYNNVNINL